MEHARDTLISWLNDAHAMERGLARLLEAQVGSAAAHPEIQEGLQRHLQETRRHAADVQGCIERLGGTPSTVKSGLSALMGIIEGVGAKMFEDELVKAALGDYAAEHLEIASYRALIEASRKLGLDDVARTCEAILRDEEAMARWLEGQLPRIVDLQLGAAAAGVGAAGRPPA